jgi:hypothetical protein
MNVLVVLLVWVMQFGDRSEHSWQKSSLEQIHVTDQLILKRPHANLLQKNVLKKETSSLEVGDERDFFIRNFTKTSAWDIKTFRLITSREHLNIWFSNADISIINNNETIQRVCDSLTHAFETQAGTYTNNDGIFKTVTATFGEIPDFDGDKKINVLLFNIVEPSGISGYIAGYFDPIDFTSHANSNQGEFLYLDIYPLIFDSPTDEDITTSKAESTFAHELQHLILQGYKLDLIEDTFINEGLSELSEIVCGYEPRSASGFFTDFNRPFFSWNYSNALPDYSRASLWFHYIYEQIDENWLSSFTTQEEVGITHFINHLQKFGIQFESSWQNWFTQLCNIGNKPSTSIYKHPARKQLSGINPLQQGTGLNERWHQGDYVAGFYQVFSPKTAWLRSSHPSTIFFPFNDEHVEIKRNEIFHFTEDKTQEWIQFWTNRNDTLPIQSLIYTEPSVKEQIAHIGSGRLHAYSLFAEYLQLNNQLRKAGIPFPINDLNEITGIGFRGLFDSEFQFSGVNQSAVRRFDLRVFELKQGIIGDILFDFSDYESRREYGNAGFEWVYFDTPFIPTLDSVFIEIGSADISNPFNIGIQHEAIVPAFITSDTWQPILYNNTPITDLTFPGFIPENMPDKHIPLVALKHLTPILKHDFSVTAQRQNEIITFTIQNSEISRNSILELRLQFPDGRFHPLEFSDEIGTGLKPLTLEQDGVYQLFAKYVHRKTIYTSTMDWVFPKSNSFALQKTYPNPFNPRTQIEINCLSRVQSGKISVYDMLGRLVKTESIERMEAGVHSIPLDFYSLASGIYFISIQITDEAARTERLQTKVTFLK